MKRNIYLIEKVLEKLGKINRINLNTLSLIYKDKKYLISLENENIVINEDKQLIYYYLFMDSDFKKSLYNFFKNIF